MAWVILSDILAEFYPFVSASGKVGSWSFRCWDSPQLFFYCPDQPVGKPGRFRESITAGAGQDEQFRRP